MGGAVEFTEEDRVARITIQRPPLNILDLPTLGELGALLKEIGRKSSADILVLSGSGSKAFSAGVDVKDHVKVKVPAMLESVHGAIRQLLALPQVTIASVQGVCLGGGLEMATSCDLIIASEDSSFATPEINVGCYPPVALARFPSQLGYRRAAEMILTGRRFDAREALAIGLINRMAPSGEVDQAVEALVKELQEKSGAVLRIALKGLREISQRSFSKQLKRSEEIYLQELLETEDVEEGVRAFVEKRKPRWRHR
jgi:cyclohexa-1,5-dienecarbonyl-CoA hydratase